MRLSFLDRDDVRLWLERAALAALVGTFVAVGFAGVDFGHHWDEWYHTEGLKQVVSTLSWNPQRQIYNGTYFLMGLPLLLLKAAPFLPGVLRDVASNSVHPVDLSTSPSVRLMQPALNAYLDSRDYTLDVRRVFVLVTSLTIVWVYLTVRTLAPRPRAAALAAAAFVALSWEVGYHARFIAVDAVVMQFVALQVFAVCRSWRAPETGFAIGWAALAAAAGAAAWASKTPALFTVLPAFALLFRPGLTWRHRRWLALTVLGSYILSAFVLSPWAFLDPFRYVGDMAFTRHAYNDVGRLVVDPNYIPGWHRRVARAAVWLFAAVPSPVPVCALLLSAIALAGWASAARREPPLAIWTGCLALYVALMSLNQIFIVRNLLLLIPLVAVMFGVGVARLLASTWRPWLGRVAVGLVVATFALNAERGLRAATSIREMTPARALDAVRTDLERARGQVKLSPELAAKLGAAWTGGMQCQPISVGGPATDSADVYLFHHEHKWSGATNNRLGGLDAVYGPLDVNTDWYINFPGKMPEGRLVRLSAKGARQASLNLGAYLVCGR